MNSSYPVGKTVVSRYEGLISFTTIDYDHFATNPCEDDDGLGQIFSFNPKHISFLKLEADTKEDAIKELNTMYKYWLPLSFTEHGNCVWRVAKSKQAKQDSAAYYDFDSTSFAGIYVPAKDLIEELDKIKSIKKRTERLTELATLACELFTNYCNGEVYTFAVNVYKERPPFDEEHDYRHDETVYYEQGGNIYNLEEAEQWAEEHERLGLNQ